MSGLHLVKRGRELKKLDLHRDFTVASPAEFITRFGGDRVIEKVQAGAAQRWGAGTPFFQLEEGEPALRSFLTCREDRAFHP